MGLEFRLDDALAPSRSSSSQNLQPTFSSCAAAAGKVASALSHRAHGFRCGARAFASQGLVSGSRVSNSRSVRAGSWAPTEGGKRGVRTVGRDGERGRRGDLSTGAGGGCTSRMCEAACPAQHWILLWSAAGGREREKITEYMLWLDATWGRRQEETLTQLRTTSMGSIIHTASLCHCLPPLSMS